MASALRNSGSAKLIGLECFGVRFHLRGRWLGAILGLLLVLGVRFGLHRGRRLVVGTATRWGRLAERRGCEKPKKENPAQSHRRPAHIIGQARGWPFAGNAGGNRSEEHTSELQ